MGYLQLLLCILCIEFLELCGGLMRISTKGRYSLEALLYLALLPETQSVNTKAISEATGISDGYLEQLFIPLRKNGMINSIRGAQGGYSLGRLAQDITVGDILRVAEGKLEPVACIDSEPCPREDICRSRFTWRQLYEAITQLADSITLKDLVVAYQSQKEPEYAI
jgi:Rrf2 family protein